ncbi:MAG: hypothetical protein F4233_01095 [Rhodospirillaceae bacterium]|nr:hypothetical protein [Rhodospirillaceae bacterium]
MSGYANTMTAAEHTRLIRRAARNLAALCTLETRAWRFGFIAGFRGVSTAAGDMIRPDTARRDWLAGYHAGCGERREFDALDPVTVIQ